MKQAAAAGLNRLTMKPGTGPGGAALPAKPGTPSSSVVKASGVFGDIDDLVAAASELLKNPEELGPELDD